MPGLSFLNPAYLIGLALLVLPLAIHLFNKKSVREIVFSDLRFLKEAVVKRRRRFELENRNLLLLRLLGVLLLVLAVAKPVIQFARTSIVREGARTQAVIVLDNSYSMGCIENGVVRFDRAKRAALDALLGLEPEDRVTLILASESPEMIYNQLPVSSLEATEKIQSAEASWKSSDLAGALATARDFLQEAEGDHKEVYLITDLQRKAFEKVGTGALSEGDSLDLYLIPVGFPDTGNLALGEVEHRPRRVGPKAECQITVKGFAYGRLAPKFAPLRLLRQGGGTTETAIPVVASAAFSQTFREQIGPDGYWLAEAELEDNVLTADNRRYLVIPVEQPGRLLLVEGEPRMVKSEWESFYFERAVKVYSTGVSGGRAYEVFIQGVSGELDEIDTAGFDVIVLANVPRMSREAVRKLENYVRRGGSLIVSLGRRVDQQSYNEIVSPKLIPCKLDRTVLNGSRPPFRIAAFLDKEKPLSIFSQSRQGDLTLPLFTGYVALDLQPDSEGRVLAKFDSGAVSLVEFNIGHGKVMLWTSSLDTDWNDLPIRPIYLPLWGEILEYLEDATAPPANVLVGEAVEISADFSPEAGNVTSLQVLMPNGRAERFEVDPAQGSFRTFFAQTAIPGFYRLQYPPGQGVKRVFPEIFAVNVSPGESDLTAASDEEIETKLEGWNLKKLSQTSRIAAQLSAARKGLAVWDILLLILVAVLVLETIYANRMWQ